jgi:hypothetical protein
VHFVLPVRIGEVEIVTGIDDRLVLESIEAALDDTGHRRRSPSGPV